MPDGEGSETSAQDLEAELRLLAQRAAVLRLVATSAKVLPLTIAASDRNHAGDEVDMVAAAIDLVLETGAADAGQVEQFAKNLHRIAATLDTALYMGGFNAPCERSVIEWRTVLQAIMAS
ncbi:MAG: hypothetical protein JWR80_9440 [Bradyrhizobium sp.]|nr:hypothetical protein [Bradyrhizobium sp.]